MLSFSFSVKLVQEEADIVNLVLLHHFAQDSQF
jgi:hypothetical protein